MSEDKYVERYDYKHEVATRISQLVSDGWNVTAEWLFGESCWRVVYWCREPIIIAKKGGQ